MSVARSRSGRALAFTTALMVLLALAIPLLGVAGAAHQQGADADVDVDLISLTPETSSNVSGSCQAFTAQASFGGQNAEGETLDIRVTTSDVDLATDATITFCTPASGTSVPVTDGGGDPTTDTDDVTGPPPAEAPATIHGECVTDAAGQCRFGVRITDANANSSGTVEVWAETDDSDTRQAGEPFDDAQISVTASGNEAVATISCTPPTDTNPEGTRHEFQCTARNASNQPVGGATVLFDVTAGPNAEEVGPTNCPNQTDSETGQTGAPGAELPGGGSTPSATGCGYTDNAISNGTGPVNSPPGTDTITVCVTQQAGAGEQQTAGCDAHEAQTSISKTWVGPGNSISCTPDGANSLPGSSVLVTCTVTDANGSPSPGQTVRFTESGPGTITPTADCTTNGQGQCSVTATTASNETGTQTITGQLRSGNCQGIGGTGGPGTPNTGTTATCTDNATINWGQTSEPPPPTDCADNSDNDGDGEIDLNDRGCRSADDPTEAGPYASAITLRLRRAAPRGFTGQVASTFNRCQNGRNVRVRRVGGNTVGTDVTNRDGNYFVRFRGRTGRYRAIVSRKVITTRSGDEIICLGDRSPVIGVRRRR